MSMINTATNEVPSFLDEPPTDIDKICWKRAYATYLNVNNKTPEECAKEPLNLIELLPVFRSITPKPQNPMSRNRRRCANLR